MGDCIYKLMMEARNKLDRMPPLKRKNSGRLI